MDHGSNHSRKNVDEFSLQLVEETLDEAVVGRMVTPPVVKKFHEEAASGVAEEIADELGSQIVAEHVVAVPVPQVLKEIIEVVRSVPRVVEQLLVVSKSVCQKRCSKRLYEQIVDIFLPHVIEWRVKVPRISIPNTALHGPRQATRLTPSRGQCTRRQAA